jgi:hypothetical protein
MAFFQVAAAVHTDLTYEAAVTPEEPPQAARAATDVQRATT